MCRLTGCTVYDEIEFHGKMGRLTLSNQKILFQHEDDSVPPRTWLWKSMKKFQVVASPEGKQIIKISNHQNKAVSFVVPESTLPTLQEDIDKRLDARIAKSEATTNTETDSSAPSTSSEEAASSEGQSEADQTPPSSAPKSRRARPRKGKSFDSEKPGEGSVRSAKKNGPAFGRSKTTDALPRRRQRGLQRSKTVEDAKECVASSSSPSPTNNRKKTVTLGRAARVVAQDVFLKPGVQAVQDYVVNPTNNLILKPTNRNIVQPAKEKVVDPAAQIATDKIIKPTHTRILNPAAQMANDKIIKPTHNRIIKPTQRAATSVLGGQSNKNQETNEAPAAEEEDKSVNEGSTDASGSTNKRGVLHFLTAPLRRTKTLEESEVTPSPVAPLRRTKTLEESEVTPSPVAISEKEDVNLVASSSA